MKLSGRPIWKRVVQVVAAFFVWTVGGVVLAATTAAGPTNLRVDSLAEPLGIDSLKPMLAWQLSDPGPGALQSAYELRVYSHSPAATNEKADIWDSGRVDSGVSAGIAYAGPELKPETRYWWTVQVWGAGGKAYPASAASWWETGLMSQDAWKAQWIGYESADLHAVRTSGAEWITNPKTSDAAAHPAEETDMQSDFRLNFTLDKPIKSAVLYATGEDTAAAWVNGKQVHERQPLPPWRQMPWGDYWRQDVTQQVRAGENLLAIAVTRYSVSRRETENFQTPMSACLYVLFADGTSRVLKSAPGSDWKATLKAPDGWWAPRFAATAWAPAVVYNAPPDPFGGESVGRPWPSGPVAALRQEFSEKNTVVSARLYATALGAYKFFLNGKPVGDQVLAPGWMDFREHVPYQVYDVTAQIRKGGNALAAYLAPGWYSTPLRWIQLPNDYGNTQPAVRAQLRLQHADGSVEWVATDASWKADSSAIQRAEIYDGETMDARLVQRGWDQPRFDDAAWQSAMIVDPKEPKIIAQYFQPIREERVMPARSITSPKPGVWIVDFGQNMAAVPRLRISGPRGEDVQLRFGEVLNPDGTLYVDNLRTAKATDHYILSGDKGEELFQPLFTFHGFRYAEITGVSTRPTATTLSAVVLHTSAPFTTQFSTGVPMVNQLWSNILWGQRSNFVGVPTDCPQRDERLGWSADAQVFWRTAAFNMGLASFSRKYAADLHGTQVGTAMYGIYAPGLDTPNPGYGAAWSDAGVIIPWTGWIQTGDPKIIDESWDGMAAYLAEIESRNQNHLWQKDYGSAFGDWLTPTVTTPEDLLATAYWAYDASLMQQMAKATGRTAEAAHYKQMFEQIREAFQKAYVHSDGFVGALDKFPSIPPPTLHSGAEESGTNKETETQTGYVLALHMNLLPDTLRQAAAARLVELIQKNNWMLGTGFLGTPYLLEVLSDTGHSDVAYRLLLNTQYPSWGYQVEHGATTMWERWNGDQMIHDPSMNSFNHYAYGAVAEWMYRYAAGVDTMSNDAGFHTIYLHPNFDGRMGHLDFTYQSTYGEIHSQWTVTGERVSWTVTVPANSTAVLATEHTNAVDFRLNGQPLTQDARVKPGSHPGDLLLSSGTYSFTATLQPSRPEAIAASQGSGQ